MKIQIRKIKKLTAQARKELQRRESEEEMKAVCWKCIHLKSAEEQSHIEIRGLNVSGKPAKYRIWDKHRCKLEQEDRYPKHCDFKLNVKLMEELDRRYPDLVAISKKIDDSRKRVEIVSDEFNIVMQIRKSFDKIKEIAGIA